MARIPRVDVAGLIYHVWNRGNAGGELFVTDKDYLAFENIFRYAQSHFGMHILAYCIMPNHWHFVVQTEKDGALSKFFQWITLTHTQRWHAVRNSVGMGHIYQGRYKSSVCESDEHFLRLVRYVERNASRAKLAQRAEDWRWSSGWVRYNGTEQQRALLSSWPVSEPANYRTILNDTEREEDLFDIRTALRRGSPYGSEVWTGAIINTHHLESTTRPRGRPWPQKI